ncbi:MAG: hypothetical protein CSA74_03180 [Rhodobacterales bacterium]|nr:MAG: hypothetical protein CSA74_03180 [Rhodobacterales bacterium]
MKQTAFALMLGALSLPALSTTASAGGVIADACTATSRGARAPALCACIQTVADSVLSGAEQKRGAQIFLDPHMSQEIRASASASDNRFWEKWRQFGSSAAQHCE